MNNTWFRIAVSVFFCTASSVFAAPEQETDFVLVALEQLRDRHGEGRQGDVGRIRRGCQYGVWIVGCREPGFSSLTVARPKDALQEVHGTRRTAFCAARRAFFRARGQGVLGAGCGYGRRLIERKKRTLGWNL